MDLIANGGSIQFIRLEDEVIVNNRNVTETHTVNGNRMNHQNTDSGNDTLTSPYRKLIKLNFALMGIAALVLISTFIFKYLPESGATPIMREEKLIIVNNDSFWIYDSKTYEFKQIYATEGPISTFDVYSKDRIFWGNARVPDIFTLTNSPDEIRINFAFNDPRSRPLRMAIDTLTGNLYVIDKSSGILVVINTRTRNYTLLLTDYVDMLDIVLDPDQGYMFISQGHSILRGSMDGKWLFKIISDVSVSSLTIDRKNRRIFWVNDRLTIESSKYDGTDRKLLMRSVDAIVSIAVVRDLMFWLLPGYKVVGPGNNVNDTHFFLKQPILHYCTLESSLCAHGMHVMQPINFISSPRMIRAAPDSVRAGPHPCEPSKTGCGQMCLVAPNGGHRCACNIGYQLKPDGKTCQEASNFLVYAWAKKIRAILPEEPRSAVFWPKNYFAPTLQRKSAIDFDYDVKNDVLFYSDDKHIYTTSLKSNSGQKLLRSFHANDYTIGLAYDWMGGNLYYSVFSTKPLFQQYLTVLNVRGNFTKTLHTYGHFKGLVRVPHSIAVSPMLGSVMFTLDEGDNHVHIVRSSLNGTKISDTVINVGSTQIRSLAIDHYAQQNYYYILNSKIKMARLNDSMTQSLMLEEFAKPVAVTADRHRIYVSDRTSIYQVVKKGARRDELLVAPLDRGAPETEIAGAKFFSLDVERSRGTVCEVNNGGCQQFCFSGPRPTCDCKDTLKLQTNGHCRK